MGALGSAKVPSAPSNSLNISLNGSLDDISNSTECTNDYCLSDVDYLAEIERYIFPTQYEWVLIALHCVVFVVGLVGNFLVCLAVYRNHTMRTVTNYFIVNLAIADFLVILLCLPPTVLWDVTETWFMGSSLCKIVLYFQTVSVSVSVLTLTFISVDRWYAICHPLKFRSTIGRAKTAIAAIWIVSLLIDIPELIILDTRSSRPDIRIETIYFTQCVATWDAHTDLINQSVKFGLLYALPLLFVSATYYQIVRVLWRSARFTVAAQPLQRQANNGQPQPATDEQQTRATLMSHSLKDGGLSINSNASTEMQLRSRRKAAKMLVVVVIVFAVCYFPVHLISVLRYSMSIPQNDLTVSAALISHWLCYFNSAINPVIYNFMSGKFRKEFRRAFHCRCRLLDVGYFSFLWGPNRHGDRSPPMSMMCHTIPSVAVVVPADTALGVALSAAAAPTTITVLGDPTPAQIYALKRSRVRHCNNSNSCTSASNYSTRPAKASNANVARFASIRSALVMTTPS